MLTVTDRAFLQINTFLRKYDKYVYKILHLVGIIVIKDNM